LGARHQVLCITHLPQVAAAAATQFVVTKEFKKERTLSSLTEVSGEARVEEIARMLGGVTDSAKAHARSLLQEPCIDRDVQPPIKPGKSTQERKLKG
ncbi:MAG: hypothetical protein WCO97_10250, partial [bacterium]